MRSASNRSGYFAFLAFSALYFAHRALVAFEILARPVADIVRLRFILLRLTIGVRDGAWWVEPFRAVMAPWMPFNRCCNFVASCFSAARMSINPPGALDT